MVKIGRLWADARFNSLSAFSKLTYCYLVTQPNISTLGVIELTIDNLSISLKIGSDVYKECREELSDKGFIHYLERDRGVWDTIVVSEHFKSLTKSKTNIRKAIDEGKKAEPDVRHIFSQIFIAEDFNSTGFKPPTPEDVADYALKEGYLVNGKDFVRYYGDNDWYDKNNRKVRNWKSKLKNVWCREGNKLQKVDGAPEGFEYFYVDVEEGVRVFPESWKDGLPTHSNFINKELLLEEFYVQRDS